MLSTLRGIVQAVNEARNLDQALTIIVARLQEALLVEVCSVYLADNSSRELILMASKGLNAESIGQVQLAFNQGLVGLVAERAEPVNLDNAPDHPRYRYFPETGEERYHAFLGVPIIHHRQLLGVLVAQRHADQRFDEDSVTFLITIAAQLAGAIAHATVSGGIDANLDRLSNATLPPRATLPERPLQGLPGAAGVAIGVAVVPYPFADIGAIPDRPVAEVSVEQSRFLQAVEAVRRDIDAMRQRFKDSLPSGDQALFDAYAMMLDSDSLVGATLQRIAEGNWAPGALRDTLQEHIRVFQAMDDEYLRERGDDIRDLGRRILLRLQGSDAVSVSYPAQTLLVGEEITASMLAEVPPDRLCGVVSIRGSRTSHSAILCRALGIPAVMGVTDLPLGRIAGCHLIADGYSGRVYLNPDDNIRREYLRLQREEVELSQELRAICTLPAETPDGVRLPFYANTGLASDIGPSRDSGAEGIGLYRTEFPFMIRSGFPSEQEQLQVYRQVLAAFAPQPVTMRTLDVGGDKALPYFPIKEDNPFLGWRGIRITLDHPEIFLAQVRAMLQANGEFGNLRLLLPMISSVSEVEESQALIRRAHRELVEDGIAITLPPVGVMIEVPSAVFQAEALARRVDFLSIGTNDLTQYLLAVDRNNSRVAELYDSLHPAVLEALIQITEAAHRQQRPVSVCGEMAGDPAAALLLLGIGVDALSMNSSSLLPIKWVIRSFTQQRAKQLLAEALTMEDPVPIRLHLQAALESAGLGGLVRAGR